MPRLATRFGAVTATTVLTSAGVVVKTGAKGSSTSPAILVAEATICRADFAQARERSLACQTKEDETAETSEKTAGLPLLR